MRSEPPVHKWNLLVCSNCGAQASGDRNTAGSYIWRAWCFCPQPLDYRWITVRVTRRFPMRRKPGERYYVAPYG